MSVETIGSPIGAVIAEPIAEPGSVDFRPTVDDLDGDLLEVYGFLSSITAGNLENQTRALHLKERARKAYAASLISGAERMVTLTRDVAAKGERDLIGCIVTGLTQAEYITKNEPFEMVISEPNEAGLRTATFLGDNGSKNVPLPRNEFELIEGIFDQAHPLSTGELRKSSFHLFGASAAWVQPGKGMIISTRDRIVARGPQKQ